MPRLPRTVLCFVDTHSGETVYVTKNSAAAHAALASLFRKLPPAPSYTVDVRGPESRAVFPVRRAAVARLFGMAQLRFSRLAGKPDAIGPVVDRNDPATPHRYPLQ